MLPGDRTDRAPRGEPVGDQQPLLLAQVPPAPRLLGLDRHCRIVQDLPDGIHDRAAVAPPRARLAADPDHPARLSVTDPLRYQPHVPPLLLGLHTARRSSPSLPHSTLQTGLMLRRPLESALLTATSRQRAPPTRMRSSGAIAARWWKAPRGRREPLRHGGWSCPRGNGQRTVKPV